MLKVSASSLQWRDKEYAGVSNQRVQPFDQTNIKRKSKPALLALCEGTHRWPVDPLPKGQ